MSNPIVVSGFPGIGKTYVAKNFMEIIDSDSSKFSWLSEGVRNSGFPNNYIKNIKENLRSNSTFIMVSSHDIVRDALVNNNIHFFLVYPDRSLKQEYIDRYKNRENTKEFVKLLEENWNNWMNELENQVECIHIRLQTGEYLSHKLDEILKYGTW